METNGVQIKNGGNKKGRWYKILLPICALLLSWLILTTWFTGLAATREEPRSIPHTNHLMPDNLTISINKDDGNSPFIVNGSQNQYQLSIGLSDPNTTTAAAANAAPTHQGSGPRRLPRPEPLLTARALPQPSSPPAAATTAPRAAKHRPRTTCNHSSWGISPPRLK